MVFVAQVAPDSLKLVQGMGFSTPEMVAAHALAHPEYIFVSTDEFVSPATHEYVDGRVVRRQESA